MIGKIAAAEMLADRLSDGAKLRSEGTVGFVAPALDDLNRVIHGTIRDHLSNERWSGLNDYEQHRISETCADLGRIAESLRSRMEIPPGRYCFPRHTGEIADLVYMTGIASRVSLDGDLSGAVANGQVGEDEFVRFAVATIAAFAALEPLVDLMRHYDYAQKKLKGVLPRLADLLLPASDPYYPWLDMD